MTRLLTCAALALVLGGCGIISRPVVSQPPASCAALIPDSWSEGVEAAPVPVTEGLSPVEQIKAWAAAFVTMSGQLAKANGRTVDTVLIVSQCEDMVNAARADRQ